MRAIVLIFDSAEEQNAFLAGKSPLDGVITKSVPARKAGELLTKHERAEATKRRALHKAKQKRAAKQAKREAKANKAIAAAHNKLHDSNTDNAPARLDA